MWVLKPNTKTNMLFLQSHHIADLYVWIDELIPKKLPSPKGGRPSAMSDTEMVTLLVWNALVIRQKTIKDLHAWAMMYHQKDFPRLPTYNAFLDHCHRTLPVMAALLGQLLSVNAPLRFMDSTMIPVCKHKRADSHKVAKMLANFGKNWQGWHYGFKLHVSIDHEGKLCAVVFTEASTFDGKIVPRLVNNKTKIAVGDSSYGGKKLRDHLWDDKGIFILAPPHSSHKQKIVAPWQHRLLSFRSKIETVFDYLKEHMHLVTSFARSINGYFLHYIRILLGYQILCLARG